MNIFFCTRLEIKLVNLEFIFHDEGPRDIIARKTCRIKAEIDIRAPACDHQLKELAAKVVLESTGKDDSARVSHELLFLRWLAEPFRLPGPVSGSEGALSTVFRSGSGRLQSAHLEMITSSELAFRWKLPHPDDQGTAVWTACFPRNFRRLVLDCLNADLCDQILLGIRKAFDGIYQIAMPLHLSKRKNAYSLSNLCVIFKNISM